MALTSFVLHLGAHKTGTSLIQKYLRDNPEFCAQAGLKAMPRSDGDRYVGWGRRPTLDEGGPHILEQAAAAGDAGLRHFVVSHENALGRPFPNNATTLYRAAQGAANRLRKALGPQPWRVVFYIRNQPDFVESYYLQTIHQGKSHDFKTFLDQIPADSLSWRPLYDALCNVYRPENVALRSFDADMADGQSEFLRRFVTLGAGIPVSPDHGFDYKPVRNPSIGDRGLELALEVNPTIKTPEERKAFRKYIQGNFSNRDYPRPVLFSPDRKAEITARYAEENKELLELSAQSLKTRS